MSASERAGAPLPAASIADGAAKLGIELSSQQVGQLQQLAAELARWNRTYNLTSIDEPREVLTQHLLDSLAANGELEGTLIADVGTGAGFPGLPLAIVNPERQFVLIDSVDKKLRFVDHVVRQLGLANVRTLHARVEQLGPDHPLTPAAFDTVLTRAFAPLPRLVQLIAPLTDVHTRVVAMKGRWPPEKGSEDAGPLPAPWRIESVRRVTVPGLAAERHMLRLTTAPGPAHDTRAAGP